MMITVKPTIAKEKYEVYKRNPSTWDAVKEELVFNVNISSRSKSWRLVYWDNTVKCLFEPEGITWTINNLFCGTEEECLGEIDRLHLKLEENIDVKVCG